jgi:hypothetical protein
MAGMLDIQVTISGATEAARRLAQANVPAALTSAVREWAQQSVPALAEATPVRTGTLQRSWRFDQPDDLSAIVGNPVDYGRFVLQGTAAHEIVPRDPAGYLRFVVGDRTVYAKRVRHPGTVADQHLSDVVEQVPRDALALLVGATERLVRTMVV